MLPRFLVVAVGFGLALAQAELSGDKDLTADATTANLETPDGMKWTFAASAFAYFVPADRDYVQPTFTADRGSLHVEARYNYEAPETGSLWLGVNFSGGEALAWEFTPMMGGVFGETFGVAPGLRGSLTWWRLALSAEAEYVMDAGDLEGTFLYLWSELTLSPVDWFRFGVASQRTRAYASDLDIQRGFVAGFTYKVFDLSAYVFNPDEDEPTLVLAAAVEF